MSLLTHSLVEISRQLRKGLVTAEELCQLCLDRIEKVKRLNAFISVTSDIASSQASAAAQRIQKGNPLSAIDGVPLAIKDNFCTRNVRTTCASKMLSDYIPPYNATVVQRLLDSGAVTVGKTNLDEFAMGSGTVDSLFGPTRNVWRSGPSYNLLRRSQGRCFNIDHPEVLTDKLADDDFFVCGGSSGGSAVAVATGCTFGAIGSDTGGSTRNPASLCGIVGLKPTYGLVSRNGLIPLCNSLDVPGLLTKTVDDAGFLLNHVAGLDPFDSTTSRKTFKPIEVFENASVKDIHIGIPKEYECHGMSPEVISTWRYVTDLLEASGAKVTHVSLPNTEHSNVCYSVLCCCDVASNFARYSGLQFGHRAVSGESAEHLFAATRKEGFGEVVRGRILAGNYFLLKNNYKRYFVKAMDIKELIKEDFRRVFDSGVDLLLTPVTLSDAVPYSVWKKLNNREHNATDDFCTLPVNMAGLPAVSLPIRLSKKGLPLSLQLIGQSFQEQAMLTVAKSIEQQVDFPRIHFES